MTVATTSYAAPPTTAMPVPLFVRWSQLQLQLLDATGTAVGTPGSYECAATSTGLTSTGGDTVSLTTLCPDGSFSQTTPRNWSLAITAAQDVESADSLMLFLMDHEGEKATATWYPKTDNQKKPVGRGWKGTVTIALPDQIGNAEAGNYATFTTSLPFDGKPQPIDPSGQPVTPGAKTTTSSGPAKGSAKPSDTFPAETTVTASDAANAAKLTALGYVAAPTSKWTSGQKITVGTYDFSWDGSAWKPGAAA